jgi:hypothetical protein
VPAVVDGVAADSYGLGHTTTGYTLFVLLMVVLAADATREVEHMRHLS